MVIWLLGISGAGKSTLGVKLKNHFDSLNIASVLIDGDLVREFFEHDLGYSVVERQHNIKRIIFAAYLLEQQGIIPIVCNISPFEALRNFAGRKLQDYVQIYLQKKLSAASGDDVKGVYHTHANNTPLVGIDIEFEEPSRSSLVLPVDEQTVEESFNNILTFLSGKL